MKTIDEISETERQKYLDSRSLLMLEAAIGCLLDTKDIEEIKKIIHRDDVITALYGYGKGEEIEETGGYGRRITFGSEIGAVIDSGFGGFPIVSAITPSFRGWDRSITFPVFISVALIGIVVPSFNFLPSKI